MSKRDDLIAIYAGDLKDKCGVTPDMDLLTKVTIGLGPAIYNPDSSVVSGTQDSEIETIRANFLIRKLGLKDGPELKAGIDRALETYGKVEPQQAPGGGLLPADQALRPRSRSTPDQRTSRLERVVEHRPFRAEGQARQAVGLEAEPRQRIGVDPAQPVHHPRRVAQHRGVGRAGEARGIDEVDLVEAVVGVVELRDGEEPPGLDARARSPRPPRAAGCRRGSARARRRRRARTRGRSPRRDRRSPPGAARRRG